MPSQYPKQSYSILLMSSNIMLATIREQLENLFYPLLHFSKSYFKIAAITLRTHPTFWALHFCKLIFGKFQKLMIFAIFPSYTNSISIFRDISYSGYPPILYHYTVSTINFSLHRLLICSGDLTQNLLKNVQNKLEQNGINFSLAKQRIKTSQVVVFNKILAISPNLPAR